MTNPPVSLEVFGQTMRSQIEQVGKMFTQPDDDWIGILHVESITRDHFIMGIDGEAFANDFTKDQLVAFIHEVITEAQAIHYGLLINTWTVVARDELEAAEAASYIGHLEDHPERIETLVVLLADRHGDEMWTATINRTEDAPPTLSAWTKFPGGDQGAYFGRFAELRDCLRET